MWGEDQEHRLHYQVGKLLFTYARGVDRKDWDLFRSAFHDDARLDYGALVGDPEEVSRAIAGNPAHVEQFMHTTSNILILEIDRPGKRVVVESHCLASQRLASTTPVIPAMFEASLGGAPLTGDRVLIAANRYVDLITERDGVLRIAERTVVSEWFASTESGRQDFFGTGNVSRRGPDDLSYLAVQNLK